MWVDAPAARGNVRIAIMGNQEEGEPVRLDYILKVAKEAIDEHG